MENNKKDIWRTTKKNEEASQVEHSRLARKLQVIIFVQALRLCLAANQYTLFAAEEGTNPETAGRTAIENIYIYYAYSD